MTKTLLMANFWSMSFNLLYAVVAMTIGVIAIKLIDHFLFPEINFTEEIKKGNISAAIFAGTLVLFLALMLSSALG
ncbi:hypothetical protein BVX98_05230 [bacterium F11]|nr:hypothetical protein BVX98_05230 [bacterium F11]